MVAEGDTSDPYDFDGGTQNVTFWISFIRHFSTQRKQFQARYKEDKHWSKLDKV